ncbi:MAG TPA: DUF4185 domain-containing protein [Kofleriaceae bacterium]|nr:DUF4185 domain-containing protein [Kofleriaceae bacterium]
MVRQLLVAAFITAQGCGSSAQDDADGDDRDAAAADAGEQPGGDATGGPSTVRLATTEHLGQLTGTAQNPVQPVGMSGTDLGVAFARDGQVAFLFGDAWIDNRDSMALAALSPPGDHTPDLTFVTDSNGHFQPPIVPGVDLGAFNVPVEAVPVGDTTYYFFSTGMDFDTMTHSHSVLAHGPGLEIDALVVDHIAPSAKFINVAVQVEGDDAWIFGSGPYRTSPVYLARVPLAQLADRAAWTYYPDFAAGAGEDSAQPVMPIACVGELSVRRQPATGLWLMAYNCGEPRGIHLRHATEATGPWSDPILIYTPEMGYERFLHASESAVGHDDGLSEAGREEEWGGEYGPYLVPEWFTEPAPGVHEIVYTLSSWNPYQVHLMRTVLVEEGATVPPPDDGVVTPIELANGDFADGTTKGWSSSGDPFAVFQRDDGAYGVTTFAAGGDATTGTLWQDFTVQGNATLLTFRLHGGDARVELRRGGEVVRRSHGRRDNDAELLVRWNLDEYRGETLRLVVVDDLTGPWGFVGARGFVLE